MNKVYRTDYTGEFVVNSKNYSNGQVTEDREWVPNTIDISGQTGYAVVVGNGTSILDFDIGPVFTHRGGMDGEKRLTSYGCNGLYRDYTPDFLISNSFEITKELVTSGYYKDHAVLAHADQIKQYPGDFHLIPYDEFTDAGTTALRLACFDGNKKVYFLGFDGQREPLNNNVYAGTPGYNSKQYIMDDSKWVQGWLDVMNTYHDVEFVRVTYRSDYPLPELLNYATNLRSISFRDFVFEADLGY